MIKIYFILCLFPFIISIKEPISIKNDEINSTEPFYKKPPCEPLELIKDESFYYSVKDSDPKKGGFVHRVDSTILPEQDKKLYKLKIIDNHLYLPLQGLKECTYSLIWNGLIEGNEVNFILKPSCPEDGAIKLIKIANYCVDISSMQNDSNTEIKINIHYYGTPDVEQVSF
jgi:hypothetical protein